MHDEHVIVSAEADARPYQSDTVRVWSVTINGEAAPANGSLFGVLTRGRSEREIALAAGLSNCLTRLTG